MRQSLALFGFLLFSLSLSAQSNSIKITENGVLFPKLGIGYERALNDTYTAGISVGGILPRTLDLSTPDLNNAASLRVSGLNTFIDFRKYSDGPFDGFFLGAHLKASRYSFDYTEEGLTEGYEFGIAFNTVGLGFNLGWSTVLFDVVSLDVIALGIGYDYHILDAYLDDATVAQDDIDSFTSALSDIPVIGDKFIFEETGDGYTLDSNFGLPSLRFGFSLGYAF